MEINNIVYYNKTIIKEIKYEKDKKTINTNINTKLTTWIELNHYTKKWPPKLVKSEIFSINRECFLWYNIVEIERFQIKSQVD